MTKRKHHEIIQNIEHKHCGKCNKWKVLDNFGKCKPNWDGLYCFCKVCCNNISYRKINIIMKKRKQARQNAPTNFSVCLHHSCTIRDPKQWLQPVDQFMDTHVHTHTLTKCCLKCRSKFKTTRNRPGTIREACRKVWDEWRKNNKCIECSQNLNHKHNYLVIEADHLPKFEKVKECSNMSYWKTKSRGVPALLAELKKCQSLCRFHHKLQTQQRNHTKGYYLQRKDRLRRRAVINKEKHKRGCCFRCERPVKEGEECAFTFDHRDPTTKFVRNGKVICPGHFVKLPQSLFDTQWPLEQAKCDLLCANCDKLKTWASRDGYKK